MRGCLVLRENVSRSGEVGSGATPPRPLAARQQQVPRREGKRLRPPAPTLGHGRALDGVPARRMKKPPGGRAGGCLRGCFGSSGVRPRYNSSAYSIPTVGASRCQAPFVGAIKNFCTRYSGQARGNGECCRLKECARTRRQTTPTRNCVSDGRAGSAPSSRSRLRSTRPRERQATKGPKRPAILAACQPQRADRLASFVR